MPRHAFLSSHSMRSSFRCANTRVCTCLSAYMCVIFFFCWKKPFVISFPWEIYSAIRLLHLWCYYPICEILLGLASEWSWLSHCFWCWHPVADWQFEPHLFPIQFPHNVLGKPQKMARCVDLCRPQECSQLPLVLCCPWRSVGLGEVNQQVQAFLPFHPSLSLFLWLSNK